MTMVIISLIGVGILVFMVYLSDRQQKKHPR